MKLSAYIVNNWLSDIVLSSKIDSGECSFSNVELSKKDIDMGLSPDCIYVYPPQRYTETAGHEAIMVRFGEDYIIVDSTDQFSVYRCIVDAFLFYSDWESQLMDSVIHQASIQRITEIAYLAFRCHIIAFDWRGIIFGCMPHDSAESIGSYFDATLFSKIQNGNTCRRVAQNIVPAGIVDTKVFPSVIAFNVFFEDNSFILFYVSSDQKDNSKAHLQLAMHMRSIVSYLKPEGDSVNNLTAFQREIIDILDGKKPDYETIDRIIEFKDWNRPESYILYRVNVQSSFALKRSIYWSLADKIPSAIVFQYRESTFMLIPLGIQEKAERELVATIPYFDASAYASMPFSDWSILPDALSQIDTTANLCENACGKLYHCKDYAWQFVFHSVCEECMKLNLIASDVVKLHNYDEENGSELLKTLNIYLRNQSNMTISAEQMFIHLNTMKYRIKKIEKLIDSDLDKFEDRQILLFSSEILLHDLPDLYNDR